MFSIHHPDAASTYSRKAYPKEEVVRPYVLLTPSKMAMHFPARPNCRQLEEDDYELYPRPRLFLVWGASEDDVRSALSALDATAAACPDRIEPGLYAPQNSFVFYLDLASSSVDNSTTEVRDAILADANVRKHPRVVVLENLAPGHPTSSLSVRQFEFYGSRVALTSTFGPDKTYRGQKDLFATFPMKVS